MNCLYPEIVGEGAGEASRGPVEMREGYGTVLEELHTSLPNQARPMDQSGRMARSLYLGS